MLSKMQSVKNAIMENKIPFMVAVGSALPFTVLAAEGDNTAYTTVLTALTTAITVTDVAAILAGCVVAGVGFFFLWFGSRKAVGSFVTALKTGRIKF